MSTLDAQLCTCDHTRKQHLAGHGCLVLACACFQFVRKKGGVVDQSSQKRPRHRRGAGP